MSFYADNSNLLGIEIDSIHFSSKFFRWRNHISKQQRLI